MTECTDKNTSACGENRCGDQGEQTVLRPAYRVDGQDTGITLSVALPGVRKEGLTVSATENILTIGADRSDAVSEEWEARWEHSRPERYELRIRLHPTLDPSKIDASLEDGVLKVGIERREEALARTISVN